MGCGVWAPCCGAKDGSLTSEGLGLKFTAHSQRNGSVGKDVCCASRGT